MCTLRAAAVAAALLVSEPVATGRDAIAEGSGRAAAVSVVGTADGTYRIDGSFRAAARAPVAWSVLTDYDNLASFVSSMKCSVASRDETGRLLVRQSAVGRAGPFRRTLTVVLDITEESPARISFRDVSGTSFESYEGSWTVVPDGEGVRVRYVLDARPRSAPPLFARSILGANARGLLEQVRDEMQRRGRE